MQSQNRIFDDLVKMMNGVAGTMAGVGREAEASMRDKMREWVGGMDFVSRDEFDAVKAMAIAAREENEALAKRIAALELGTKPGASAKPAAAAKPKAAPKPRRGAKN
jgi:BMFP domain-containing protein YqiC